MTSPWWFLGSAGLLAIEGSYLPQILRLHRLKRADDVSVFFPALNLVGRLLALSYALLAQDQVFTVGLMVGVVLRATLLVQVATYRYGHRPAGSYVQPGAGVAGLLAGQTSS